MPALLQLLRPLNGVLFLAAVALGGWLAAGPAAFEGASARRLLLAVLAGAAVGAASNAINDVYDVAIDRVNRPDRPLPAGRVSVGAARALWAVVSALGVALGFAASPGHGAIAAAAVALLWAYAAQLKRVPGWGHAVVAGVIALGVVYGGLATAPSARGTGGGLGAALVGAGLTWLVVFAREIAKALEDLAGDLAEGARTLPAAWGPRPAARVALAGIGLALTALPLVPLSGFDPSFFAYAVPLAGCLLAAAWALLVADARAVLRPGAAGWRPGAGRASAWLKAGLAVGIAALALAR